MWGPTKNLGLIVSAVLTFSGYKQTDKKIKYIDENCNGLLQKSETIRLYFIVYFLTPLYVAVNWFSITRKTGPKVLFRVSIRKTLTQFLRNETQNFSFFAHQFCAKKKQQFAQSFAKVISRKIGLYRFCETQVLRNSATRVLRNSAIS